MDGSLLETGYRLLLCITGALIAVLLLRLPLRYAFGSRIAYLIWLLVPIAVTGLVVGSLTPMRAFTPIALQVQVLDVRLPRSPALTTSVPFGETNWIVVCWMLGVGLFALIQWWQQYAFVRRLGVLQHTPSGVWVSEHTDIGPVVVGVLPPKIVLPADFYQRYTAPEQIFALAHESMHILRRDPIANFGVAIVRSLFWFHPLVHLAIRYFRIDQEFACDAAVLDLHSQDRHHYARAILKGQISSQTLPAGCRLASQTASSLKRRIVMLQTPAPSFWQRVLGATVIAVSFMTGGSLAWASQSSPTAASVIPLVADTQTFVREEIFQVSMKISKKNPSGHWELLASPTMQTEANKAVNILVGEEIPVRTVEGDRVTPRATVQFGETGYMIEMVVARLRNSPGREIVTKVAFNASLNDYRRAVTIEPGIIMREKEPSRIVLDDKFELEVVVTKLSK